MLTATLPDKDPFHPFPPGLSASLDEQEAQAGKDDHQPRQLVPDHMLLGEPDDIAPVQDGQHTQDDPFLKIQLEKFRVHLHKQIGEEHHTRPAPAVAHIGEAVQHMPRIRDTEQQHQKEEPGLDPGIFLPAQKQHCDGHGAHSGHTDDGIPGKPGPHKGGGQFLIKARAVQHRYVILRPHPSRSQHLHHYRQKDHGADGKSQQAVEAESSKEVSDRLPFPAFVHHEIPEHSVGHREEPHHVEEIEVHHPGNTQGQDIHKGLLPLQDLIHP